MYFLLQLHRIPCSWQRHVHEPWKVPRGQQLHLVDEGSPKSTSGNKDFQGFTWAVKAPTKNLGCECLPIFEPLQYGSLYIYILYIYIESGLHAPKSRDQLVLSKGRLTPAKTNSGYTALNSHIASRSSSFSQRQLAADPPIT